MPDDPDTPTAADEPASEGSPFGAPESPDDVGRDRLREALLRPSRGQIVVGVLLAVLGFAAITQVRTNTTDDTFAGYREQELVDVLSGLSDTSQRAQTQINQLETSRQRLEQNQQAQDAAIDAAQKQAEELSIMAGWVPVTGPGIRLSVTEGPRPVDVNTVLDTVEELRSAGAEAMQVNGTVRLVAQSAIEPAPGGLTIDGTLVTSPYVFDAIGDPHTLRGALELVDGPVAQFREDAGATVRLDELDSMDITAVRQPTTPQYAQPQ
jgi:uncharacterized protein YlxW (UPF0749 family)